MKRKYKKRRISSAQIIIAGFLSVIMIGTFLLMLPVSSRGFHWTPLLDALFTTTSAVCVTGLVVQDTATYWSTFGQAVILTLIQIGGMGVITMAIFITTFSGKKIGLMQRSTMQESISAPHIGGIVKLTRFILQMTILFEVTGAILMYPVFCKDFGWFKGIWYALFHSVSAFCNAGFDLMGVRGHFSSLTSYSANPIINIVIMLLIVIGGIGFLTWEDILVNKWHFKKYRMQTKVILVVTGWLIVLPAIYIFFCELGSAKWSGLSVSQRVLGSFFQSITLRTAGFNTLDLAAFKEPGQMIMIFLMLIGGSPGSTAGGMKTTTFAVLMATMLAVFVRREDVNFFGRRIPDGTVKFAATILMMYIVLFLAGSIGISSVENLPMLTCMFEAGSAIGTVGLTLGITSSLGTASRLILIVLMFLGRVGGLTLIFAAISGTRHNLSRVPQENITVG